MNTFCRVHASSKLTASVPRSELRDFLYRLSPNTTLVTEIKRFPPISSQFNEGQIELVDGSVSFILIFHLPTLTKIVRSFPESITLYLRQVTDTRTLSYRSTITPLLASMMRFHANVHSQSSLMEHTFVPYTWTPFISMTQRLPSSIVCIRPLYLFSGILTVYSVNTGIPTFTYAEFLSHAMAKVWAGKADLPSTTELWRRCDEVVEDRGGYGKHLQYLGSDRTQSNCRSVSL